MTGAECQRKVASRGASQRLAGYVSHSAVALLLKKRQQKLKRYELQKAEQQKAQQVPHD